MRTGAEGTDTHGGLHPGFVDPFHAYGIHYWQLGEDSLENIRRHVGEGTSLK